MEICRELRFGSIGTMLFTSMGIRPMKQLDLLDLLFPGLFVEEIPAEEGIREAEFDDRNLVIRACRVHDSLYVGSSRRVSQILGRLAGTAKGNIEKERKTAELMQKRAAEIICTDDEYACFLKEHIRSLLYHLEDEEQEAFVILCDACLKELMNREGEECSPDVLFPLDPEVFEGIVYHACKQFKRDSGEGIVNCWLWLLLGSLLRNESGRILRLYDSSFIKINRIPGEDNTFAGHMDYLLHPEEYESVYYGDELERKYPGIEFYCDRCGEHLNEQEGFDDHQSPWKCTACGFENEISEYVIYESTEDRRMGMKPIDGEEIMRAIRRRREEEQED